MTRARLALVLCLFAASSACSSTALERKEAVIQAALESAVLACKAALNDPAITWDTGAREYCERIVSPTGCAP